ncbi:hypothetical protein Y1Q_0022107 [Alligator mississippiensis]|uniref:Uncharacterized protein n=1 Tax=Alligator mississippiensis TaxID=8496 RepID=A0A151M4Q2_ALLMI|nr:hypothetical protein Y1Q_0022107 [Alligator mississippiensis]
MHMAPCCFQSDRPSGKTDVDIGTAAESAVTTQVLQAPFLQEATDHSTDFLSLLQSLPSYSLKGFCSSVVFTKKNRQSQLSFRNT